jgi:hypothetical protein
MMIDDLIRLIARRACGCTTEMLTSSIIRVQLGRIVLQQGPFVIRCNGVPASAHARNMFTLMPLTDTFRLKAFPKSASRELMSGILQFTRTTPWKATHLGRQIPPRPSGGRKPHNGSWIDELPQPAIFWGIFVANIGVFLAWFYAENNVVRPCVL